MELLSEDSENEMVAGGLGKGIRAWSINNLAVSFLFCFLFLCLLAWSQRQCDSGNCALGMEGKSPRSPVFLV